MDRRALFSKITQLFGDGGLPAVAAAACHKLISPWIETGYIEFFAGDFCRCIPTDMCNAAMSVRQASIDDIPMILDVYESPGSAEKIEKRFGSGDSCFIAVNGRNNVVHVSWVSHRLIRVPELNLELPLRRGELYNYDVYTRPDMRRQGVDAAARACTYRQLREMGCHRIYLYVHGENVAGLRAARRSLNSIRMLRYWRLRSARLLYPDLSQPSRLLEDFLRQIRPTEESLLQVTHAIPSQRPN